MASAMEVVDATASISPDARGTEAHERFLATPQLVALALVRDGAPIGLLSRHRFYAAYGRNLGRALYDRRPVSLIADFAPLFVEATTPLSELNRLLQNRPDSFVHGFIVVDHGIFAGIGSAASVHRAASRDAERANAMKSRFLACISHELRTPLHAILGYAEMIEEQAASALDEIADDARQIRAAGRHLLGMINDILDLAKIEAGRIDLAHEIVDISDWLMSALVTIEPLAAKQRNLLIVEADENLGEAVIDRARLTQCLVNLAANACKFTSEGRVAITVRREADEKRARLVLTVRDTGIGMDAEQLKHLFQPFETAASSISRKTTGAGLGLSITKAIVVVMRGHITATSTPGQGSAFEITLPIDEPECEALDLRSQTRRAVAQAAAPAETAPSENRHALSARA